jgi:PAS domain S-box-containing protein
VSALWLEVDEDGEVLRRSDAVAALMAAAEPPVIDLRGVFDLRTDVRAAVGRRAGAVRFGLGRGPGRVLLDADVGPGALGGARLVARVATREDDPARLLLAHVELHPDAVVVTDPDGVITWCDTGFAQLVGYPRGAIVGAHRRVFRSPRVTPEHVERYWRSLFATGSFAGQTILRRADGGDRLVHESASAVRDAEGRTTHYVASVRDVTTEREAERVRNLDAAVRLMARVAGAEAHSINDVGAQMLALCEHALLSDDPGSAGQALDRIIRLVGDLGDIGRRLLMLSAAGTPGAGPTDLSRIVADLRTFVERASRADAPPVRSAVSGTGPWVRCGEQGFMRACVVLVLRALDGGVASGDITLDVRTEYDEGVLRIAYLPTSDEREGLRWLIPGGAVTGPLAHELVAYALGTGLFLDRDELPDGRVVVCVRAPLADPPPAPARASEAGCEGRRGRALIVEDNEDLRELVVQALEPMFASIAQAADGDAALAALEAERFDFVLLDLRLPGPSGIEVLGRLRREHPATRVVVASGAAPDGVAQSILAEGAFAVMRKPFRLSELRAVVRGVLDGASW